MASRRLLAHKVFAQRSAAQSAAGARALNVNHGAKTITLLEKLFPARRNRNIGLGLGSRAVDKISSRETAPSVAPHKRNEGQRSREPELIGTNVLILRNACKNLTEDDIRRCIPHGQHIQGWKTKGDLINGMNLLTACSPMSGG